MSSPPETATSPFLTAEWKWLAMANYAVDPDLLKPYLPAATELDLWGGQCFLSLVGFLFWNTRLKGIRIPFHRNFEEVNLRTYVRYRAADGQWRRGVVFLSEIVPLSTLAFVANRAYQEHYRSMPMRHDIHRTEEALTVQYEWKGSNWNSFCVVADTGPAESDGVESFIIEHYFGYTRLDAHRTAEYRVEHPVWRTYPVQGFEIKVDFKDLYGPSFAFLEGRRPDSVLLAEGSDIRVGAKRVIKSP
jgi:uncharacterized protein YqjF (DUF2071 family)